MKKRYSQVLKQITLQDSRKNSSLPLGEDKSEMLERQSRLTYLLNRCTGKVWVLVIKDDPENEGQITTEVKLSNDNIYQQEDACREAYTALYRVLPLSLTDENFVKAVEEEELSEPVRKGKIARYTISFPNPEITEDDLKRIEKAERSAIKQIKKGFEGAVASTGGLSSQVMNKRSCTIL